MQQIRSLDGVQENDCDSESYDRYHRNHVQNLVGQSGGSHGHRIYTGNFHVNRVDDPVHDDSQVVRQWGAWKSLGDSLFLRKYGHDAGWIHVTVLETLIHFYDFWYGYSRDGNNDEEVK